MHDEKLARGFARQIMRELKKSTDLTAGPLLEITKHLLKLYRRGGPPNVVSEGLSLERRFRLLTGCKAEAQIVKHPTRKRVLVETMRPVVVEGIEQDWLVCAACLYDLQRDILGMVETSAGIGVSHHAIARMHERSNFSVDKLSHLVDVMTLFASPMIRACFQRQWHPGQQVAVPFLEGLLLGSVEANFHEEGQGPSFGTISANGVSEMTMLDCAHIVSADQRCTVKVCIHTFVGDYDLFPNQRAIRDELSTFGANYKDELASLRTDLFRGYPDERMLARFGAYSASLNDGTLNMLDRTIQSFYDTPEWKQHLHAGKLTSASIH